MNELKNNLAAAITVLGIIVLCGFVAMLVLFDKDPSTYIGSISVIVIAVGGLGLIGNRVDKVSKNVNGNSTRLLDENSQLRERNAYLEATFSEAPVDNGFKPSQPLMTEDTITRIRKDKDSLPAHKAE